MGQIKGIDRLTPTEQGYYEVLTKCMDNVIVFPTKPGEVMLDLFRRGHLNAIDDVLKITESGFQLFDFLTFKITGQKPRPQREVEAG